MPEIAIPTPHVIDQGRIDHSRPTSRRTAPRTILRDATAAHHARLDARLGALDLWMFFNGSNRFVFWFDLPQRHWNHILLVAITPRSEQCDCESEADKMNQR